MTHKIYQVTLILDLIYFLELDMPYQVTLLLDIYSALFVQMVAAAEDMEEEESLDLLLLHVLRRRRHRNAYQVTAQLETE